MLGFLDSKWRVLLRTLAVNLSKDLVIRIAEVLVEVGILALLVLVSVSESFPVAAGEEHIVVLDGSHLYLFGSIFVILELFWNELQLFGCSSDRKVGTTESWTVQIVEGAFSIGLLI